jgi:hypothetical protein
MRRERAGKKGKGIRQVVEQVVEQVVMEATAAGGERGARAERHTRCDLAFLRERASDRERPLAAGEREALAQVRTAFLRADSMVIRLGGRAGRLGECIVGTALLEGTLQALRLAGKADVPIRVVVDAGAAELWDERLYQARGWAGTRVVPAPVGAAGSAVVAETVEALGGRETLVLDCGGASDGMPALELGAERVPADGVGVADAGDAGDDGGGTRRVATLARLFRVGVRDFACRGPARRYADFVEELLGLPAGALDGLATQPTLVLGPEDEARCAALARALGLREEATLVMGFLQSVVPAKCYGRWREVMALVCDEVARRAPGRRLDFLIACGPDEVNPVGVWRADLEAELGDFSGTNGNARVVVAHTPSLRELAILTRRAGVALANDTGPGHLAGALGVATVTPYLPGGLYSRMVWSSSPWHRGVTLEPNPYSVHELEAAVLWDRTDIIDAIAPEELARAAVESLERQSWQTSSTQASGMAS